MMKTKEFHEDSVRIPQLLATGKRTQDMGCRDPTATAGHKGHIVTELSNLVLP